MTDRSLTEDQLKKLLRGSRQERLLNPSVGCVICGHVVARNCEKDLCWYHWERLETADEREEQQLYKDAKRMLSRKVIRQEKADLFWQNQIKEMKGFKDRATSLFNQDGSPKGNSYKAEAADLAAEVYLFQQSAKPRETESVQKLIQQALARKQQSSDNSAQGENPLERRGRGRPKGSTKKTPQGETAPANPETQTTSQGQIPNPLINQSGQFQQMEVEEN